MGDQSLGRARLAEAPPVAGRGSSWDFYNRLFAWRIKCQRASKGQRRSDKEVNYVWVKCINNNNNNKFSKPHTAPIGAAWSCKCKCRSLSSFIADGIKSLTFSISGNYLEIRSSLLLSVSSPKWWKVSFSLDKCSLMPAGFIQHKLHFQLPPESLAERLKLSFLKTLRLIDFSLKELLFIAALKETIWTKRWAMIAGAQWAQ